MSETEQNLNKFFIFHFMHRAALIVAIFEPMSTPQRRQPDPLLRACFGV